MVMSVVCVPIGGHRTESLKGLKSKAKPVVDPEMVKFKVGISFTNGYG